MSETILDHAAGGAMPIHAVLASDWPAFADGQPPRARAAAGLARFTGTSGQLALVPDGAGALERVFFGLGESPGATGYRALPALLPAGDYRMEASRDAAAFDRIALAWALGAYRFDRYSRASEGETPRLMAPAGVDPSPVRRIAHAMALARDMINTPANDMGPLQVETIARQIARASGAELTVTVGDDLIGAGYPAVHAVGRAAAPARAPRMLEMAWGRPGDPLVALVGKGVVFDSGGLDIKPSAGMRWMKKDMGGAAHALALGRLIMEQPMPVRLHILIPVVENAIAGDAMRPGDVLASRKGLTIEVGNTDAEGRLILADALARAAELEPLLTLDLATLTAAARVALGPDVVPFYTEDDALAEALATASAAMEDPLWRMPLWAPYAAALNSDIADIRNDPDPWAQAGSVAAALFLQRFAPKRGWAHFDIFAWNPRARPGWPQGGEAQAIGAIFAMLQARFR